MKNTSLEIDLKNFALLDAPISRREERIFVENMKRYANFSCVKRILTQEIPGRDVVLGLAQVL